MPMDLLESIPKDWLERIGPFFSREDALSLQGELDRIYASGETVYPEKSRIFRALETTPYGSVKALWLGQDPYHGPGQATGLAFAVPNGTRMPPSLRNIFREYASDFNLALEPVDSSLEQWAANGVLLLNTVLTVSAHKPMSHRGIGWEKLTRAVVSAVSLKKETVAFILLGNDARAFAPLIDSERHVVFQAAHPSPLSAYRGFFGSRLFTRVNDMLAGRGAEPVDWRIC